MESIAKFVNRACMKSDASSSILRFSNNQWASKDKADRFFRFAMHLKNNGVQFWILRHVWGHTHVGISMVLSGDGTEYMCLFCIFSFLVALPKNYIKQTIT